MEKRYWKMYPQDQERQKSNRYFSRTRGIILSFAMILIVVGTISAILTQGGWATILSLILTALGVVLTLLQIAFPSSSKEDNILPTTFEEPVTVPASAKEYKICRDQLKANLAHSNYGALVVYANKNFVGCIVFIYVRLLDLKTREYENGFRNMKPACIAQRQINNHYFYATVFPRLRSNTYHVELHPDSKFSFFSPRWKTVIEVLPEQVAEIDWRHVQI